jgi:DNA-binding transcriptional LysR family regulator
MFCVTRPAIWHLSKDGERFDVTGPARLALDNNMVARDAVADGLGIALLPRLFAAPYVKDGRLAEILPGWIGPPAPLHAVFPSSRYLPLKVRAFVDLARANVPKF